ncbi:MAG: putative nucleotidyltransferase [Cryomorphaceae bacterium]|jgi:predicted nucleotidyltransferase
MDIEAQIQKLLCETEQQLGVRILYACESGSRAWGFASPDSDYDIRFIYAYPEYEYLKVFSVSDTIEIPIKDDLDPGGWEVRKALSLLRKSNGALSEWLHSPIVYREEPGFLDQWRAAYTEVFSDKALYDHYRGLARRMWKGSLGREHDEVRAKTYLYCLRSTLAALWVADRCQPSPVEFTKLLGYLPQQLDGTIDKLLEYKSDSGEKETMPRIPELDNFLEAEVEREQVADMRRPPQDCPGLDRLFQQTISVKKSAYIKKSDFSLSRVREKDLLLFETVAGSQAYGTNTPESDVDLRGIFAAPDSFLTAAQSIEQVQDEKGDEVYYELGKYMQLLMKSNPNALEMLYMPEDCLRYRHPVMDLLDPQLFLTKQCEMSFGGYALGQVRKARGLNKKIVNPEPEKRKDLIDFCQVLDGQGGENLTDWLKQLGVSAENCGLVAVNHAPNTYAIFYDTSIQYRGVFSSLSEQDVICSSVPKGAEPIGWMVCNVDAFKRHCKLHKEYWHWVKTRNENRFLINSEHGRGYDSKNMMHTMRLLEIAEMIAVDGTVQLRSPNVDFLMQVRNGNFSYDEVLQMAEEKMQRVSDAYIVCSLPETVDFHRVNEVFCEMREFLR